MHCGTYPMEVTKNFKLQPSMGLGYGTTKGSIIDNQEEQ